jgi:hypothetical protein
MSALDKLREHEETVIRNALAQLERLRAQIEAKIASEDLSEFMMRKFRAIQRDIEVSIREFEDKLKDSLLKDLGKAFEIGIEMADEPIKAAFLSISNTPISSEALRVAAVFSADLIQGLSNDVRAKVNGVLRRAALGTMTTQEAIDEIGRSIDKGAFKSIAARAETIVRTEVLRIQSIATQLRQEANKKTIKGTGYELFKRWLPTHDARTRASHLLAEGQTQEIDEPFTVGGEELMFPRDPDGSPENTINCRCTAESVVERISIPLKRAA